LSKLCSEPVLNALKDTFDQFKAEGLTYDAWLEQVYSTEIYDLNFRLDPKRRERGIIMVSVNINATRVESTTDLKRQVRRTQKTVGSEILVFCGQTAIFWGDEYPMKPVPPEWKLMHFQ